MYASLDTAFYYIPFDEVQAFYYWVWVLLRGNDIPLAVTERRYLLTIGTVGSTSTPSAGGRRGSRDVGGVELRVVRWLSRRVLSKAPKTADEIAIDKQEVLLAGFLTADVCLLNPCFPRGGGSNIPQVS